jgi:glycerophosphoryl diester phosphodiesterase
MLVPRPLLCLLIAWLVTTQDGLAAERHRPIVIAHRGASGYRPEHTMEAYRLAIEQGADFIEPDVVMTKDGQLLARHDALLARVELEESGEIRREAGQPKIDASGTSTNVWLLPQYADRLRVREVDGHRVGGWFVEDFTAAEIRADVRAQERLPELRPANTAYNNLYVIPTLAEVLDLARERNVGVYVETKHPTHFQRISEATGLPRMEDQLLRDLHDRFGKLREAPVYIQSFEVANLQYLNRHTELRLIQLLTASGQPQDFRLNHDVRTYADLTRTNPQGLPFVKSYADGLGVHIDLVLPTDADSPEPTTLVPDAHQLGLEVHLWTFRAENHFLPRSYRSSERPADLGNLPGRIDLFLRLGVDGIFTDHPDLGVQAVVRSRR